MKWFKKKDEVVVEEKKESEINLHENITAVIMPFKYTDGKENSLYAWRAFSYGKKIEIFC